MLGFKQWVRQKLGLEGISHLRETKANKQKPIYHIIDVTGILDAQVPVRTGR